MTLIMIPVHVDLVIRLWTVSAHKLTAKYLGIQIVTKKLFNVKNLNLRIEALPRDSFNSFIMSAAAGDGDLQISVLSQFCNSHVGCLCALLPYSRLQQKA